MSESVKVPTGSESPEAIQEAFISAVANDGVREARLWAQAGASASAKDRFGRSALAEATMRFYQRPKDPKGNLEMLRLALELGADPNETWGRNEEPALHLAMAGGSVEAARELAGAGANVGAVNASGDTALHIAARQPGGKPHGAAYLLSLGIDPKAKNNKGRSALQEALAKNPEVAAVIKAFGEARAKMKTQREARAARTKVAPGQIDLFEGKAAAAAGVSAEAARQEAKLKARERAAELAEPEKPKRRHALTEQKPGKARAAKLAAQAVGDQGERPAAPAGGAKSAP